MSSFLWTIPSWEFWLGLFWLDKLFIVAVFWWWILNNEIRGIAINMGDDIFLSWFIDLAVNQDIKIVVAQIWPTPDTFIQPTYCMEWRRLGGLFARSEASAKSEPNHPDLALCSGLLGLLMADTWPCLWLRSGKQVPSFHAVYGLDERVCHSFYYLERLSLAFFFGVNMFKGKQSIEKKTEWLNTSKGGYDLEFVHPKHYTCNSGSLRGERERKKKPKSCFIILKAERTVYFKAI